MLYLSLFLQYILLSHFHVFAVRVSTFSFTKSYLAILPDLWYSTMLQEGEFMRSTLEELWYGNISPETVRSVATD